MPRSAARSGAGQESLAPLLPPFRASPSPSPRYLNLALAASADEDVAASDDDGVLAEEHARSGPCQGAHRAAELRESLEVDEVGEQDGGVGGGDRGT